MKTIKCKCDFCRLSKRMRRIMSKLNKRDSNFINGFMCRYCDMDADLEHKTLILKGNWPSAVEQLERALKIAKEKRAAGVAQ